MTTPPAQQTELRHVYYQCRLGRSEIDRVLAVAVEGIPESGVVVSTQRGDTRFRQATLPELLDAVAQANVPGDLDEWSNLRCEAVEESVGRKVDITMDLERVEVRLAGSDATWAYGQAARLERLIQATGGVTGEQRRKQDRENYLVNTSIASIMLSILLFLFVWQNAKPKPKDQYVKECLEQFSNRANVPSRAIALAAVFFVCVAITTAIAAIARYRATSPTLRVNGLVRSGSWWSSLSTSNRLAFLGIPIALLAAIAAAISAITDIL
ncbi:hypothetical protein ABZ352_28190 [Streptomyces griseofuscus]|uniref:hypothetical protein n=1 Tax=Streptomyces griseofuscus TaxID=146922 RepID=UPI0033D2F41E